MLFFEGDVLEFTHFSPVLAYPTLVLGVNGSGTPACRRRKRRANRGPEAQRAYERFQAEYAHPSDSSQFQKIGRHPPLYRAKHPLQRSVPLGLCSLCVDARGSATPWLRGGVYAWSSPRDCARNSVSTPQPPLQFQKRLPPFIYWVQYRFPVQTWVNFRGMSA